VRETVKKIVGRLVNPVSVSPV